MSTTTLEAYKSELLTKAIDLSARLKCPVKLPITPEDERREMLHEHGLAGRDPQIEQITRNILDRLGSPQVGVEVR